MACGSAEIDAQPVLCRRWRPAAQFRCYRERGREVCPRAFELSTVFRKAPAIGSNATRLCAAEMRVCVYQL